MDQALIDQFIEIMAGLVGQTCWSVQVSGIGSLANLHFGEKIKRPKPMIHQDFRISMEERAYHGEYILYLEECPWRLDGPDGVLVTWMDSADPGGRIYEKLPLLKEHTVQNTEVFTPGLDLAVHFDGGYTLRIFPDQVDADEGDNYSFTHRDNTYIVTARSQIYIE